MKKQYEPRLINFYIRDGSVGEAGLALGPHLHKHIEILYMQSGKIRAGVDTELCEVESGDMLVVLPDKVHSYKDLEPDIKYFSLFIDPCAVPEFRQRFLELNVASALIKRASDNDRLDSLFKALLAYQDFPEEHREMLAKGYLLAFCGEFVGMMGTQRCHTEENSTMKSIVSYCSQNFTKELSLSVLEKELGLSKYYISHLFGDVLNIGFTDYVNSLRISEACRLLRSTDHNITDIASMSGFGTPRTFNRAFIKHAGISPSAYRKSQVASEGTVCCIYC